MDRDPRVTPSGDAAPEAQAAGRLTVERLAMELASELGIDPSAVADFGLHADPAVKRQEAQTHSPKSRPDR
nr:MAG: hypothetical protein DIU55_12410 [Bacillota bacterium]